MSLSDRLIQDFQSLALQGDDDFDCTRAGLLVSKILKPSGDPAFYEEKLTVLAERLARYPQDKDDLVDKVAALRAILVEAEGFCGDEDAYDDLDHMNLFCVLDQKCGTAMTLSLIYRDVAKRCGWAVEVLNFPGHSLIRLEEGAARVILDPFAGCIELTAFDLRQFLQVIGGPETELSPVHYDAISPKTLIMRHLFAIKSHFLRCEQISQALEILHVLILLEENSAAYWREAGLLQARIGLLKEAVFSLEKAVENTTDPQAIRHTQNIIADIKKGLSE
ncbi:transglutaminase-like domain-containing protein [Terasakiella sp. A23]|uniref:transglutaminase-like domain-containing protein n=1 Tax=Terasakiella sp. FCG-A23 TaxID=3080561 RepID=UPI00295529AC|nr:transglutaminase-like domain-containing protein [Terasakiella sp. A23]MDV7339907.1 transglutaminase-like domain-containing protein [Terasakiella sp. A23]